MPLSWFVTWAFLKAVLIGAVLLAVVALIGFVVVCWTLARSTESLNRHSSSR